MSKKINKTDGRSTSACGSTPKINHLYKVTPCPSCHIPCLVDIRTCSWVMLLTDGTIQRTNDRITNNAMITQLRQPWWSDHGQKPPPDSYAWDRNFRNTNLTLNPCFRSSCLGVIIRRGAFVRTPTVMIGSTAYSPVATLSTRHRHITVNLNSRTD